MTPHIPGHQPHTALRSYARAEALGAATAILLLTTLTGCSAPARGLHPQPTPRVIPTGAFASIPPIPTSYAALGAFGRYAAILDRTHHTRPDFQDWNVVADGNCATVEIGNLEAMNEPSAMLAQPDDTVKSGDVYIHPLSGKVWAAAVTTRCPQLLTPAVRRHIEIEQVNGLKWVAAQQ